MSDLFYRSVKAESIEVDEKKRTATVSFSSEFPVKRYMGDEILLHGEKNVDFDYLNTVGSVLRRHGGDMNDIVGPVHKAWIDDRRGAAIIGFDDDENGNLALQKMKSGSLRGISFGYRIEKGIRLREETDVWVDPETKREYKGPAIIGIRWRAHEITLTPIPADHTVGFNRSLVENIKFENLKRETQENSRMDEKYKKEVKEMIEDAVTSAIREIPKGITADEVRAILKEDSTPEIQVDKDTLRDLSSRASAVSDDCKSKMFDMALEGRSHIELLNFITDEATKDGDANHRRSANDDHHDDDNKPNNQYRKVEDIPDDMFSNAFKTA